MTLDERLEDVSIIGAAGKMGSGIAVLIAAEMAKIKEKYPDKIFHLNLIDVSEKGLYGLHSYMKQQAIKLAEKNIVSLRKLYEDRKDLVENYDIIAYFADEVLSVCNFNTGLSPVKHSNIIFEAIIEDVNTKIKILNRIKELTSQDALYFTNTSSIPIGLLDDKVGLNGRIIGYHFYNPPVIQKLVEVITNENTCDEIKDVANELGNSLRKKLVPANDISGFIGNGHFARDGLYALQEVERLSNEFSLPEAIYIMNTVTQTLLIRPMGIFQLIDYVGIDVVQAIFSVMREYIPDPSLQNDLLDKMMKMKVKAGQYSDGTQIDGFLQYKRSKPIGIFDINQKEYIPLQGKWKEDLDKKIGALPEGCMPWRALLVDPAKQEKLKQYFDNLRNANTLGAKLAIKYLERSKEIGKKLVADGVANTEKDVNNVLIYGFYHLYGPINDY